MNFSDNNISVIIYSDNNILEDLKDLNEIKDINIDYIKILMLNDDKIDKNDSYNNFVEVYTDIFFEYELK